MGVEAALPLPEHRTTTVSEPSRSRRIALRLARWIGWAMLGYWVLAVLLLGVYRVVEPPITGVQLQRRIEAALGRSEYAPQRRWIPYARIPLHVSRAFVAAEDGRFWTHNGYDFEEMKNAGADALQGERIRGGSTITQQLVKNLFGCACRNPVRKIYDWTLALPAELILGKQRILELYLNNVELGDGIFGVDAAARHYFGVSAREMSRGQAASLAAILPNPRVRRPERMGSYRAEILRRMEWHGW